MFGVGCQAVAKLAALTSSFVAIIKKQEGRNKVFKWKCGFNRAFFKAMKCLNLLSPPLFFCTPADNMVLIETSGLSRISSGENVCKQVCTCRYLK